MPDYILMIFFALIMISTSTKMIRSKTKPVSNNAKSSSWVSAAVVLRLVQSPDWSATLAFTAIAIIRIIFGARLVTRIKLRGAAGWIPLVRLGHGAFVIGAELLPRVC